MKPYYRSAIVLLGMAAVLSFGACTDDGIIDERKGVKDGVSFAVSDIQDAPEDQALAPAAKREDYAVQKIDFTQPAGNACLQETTIPGVNPVKHNSATRSDFQNSIGAPFGAFACKNGSGKPDFFYNEKVAANGTMVSPKIWERDATSLQFYAVYPFVENTDPNIKLISSATGDLPEVEFTTSTDIANQIDLMTASTQNVNHTSAGGGEHVVPLTFYHSLTAIRFGVGSNLSWGKTIKSVEFQGVYSKGIYSIKTKTWRGQNTTQNYKLDNIGVSTSAAVNNVILKDGHTFLMVPQTLPTNAKIVVTFSDNTRVTAKIEGKTWKPGTTKTYMITEKNSNWNYIIQASAPSSISNAGGYLNYGITSFRQVGTEQQSVKWKVVGYDANNDGIYSMDEKPEWIGLQMLGGNGGATAEESYATVLSSEVDLLAERNMKLKTDPKGSVGNYYDLSTHDIKGNAIPRHTANCYIISHPGFYKIPLVYGNAIKGTAAEPNKANESSYKTQHTGVNILRNFKDHNEQNITDPWIERTNGGANNGVNGAKIVWADEPNLVHLDSHPIVRNGGETFLQFEVKESDIKQGNAVVAVTKGGTIVWSWHLWFAPDNVLDKIEITNHGGAKYNFASEVLGWKYTEWKGSEARSVKVKVEQELGNIPRQTAEFTFLQKAGERKNGSNPYFQFGRKDALPFIDDVPEGSFAYRPPLQASISNTIQHPDRFVSGYYAVNYIKYNLWSMESTSAGYNDNPVVKTVYDPSPAGFKLPASNAFTGFTTTGQNVENDVTKVNIANSITSESTYRWKVWTNSSKNATIYIPLSGFRTSYEGKLESKDTWGYFWTAIPQDTGNYGCQFAIYWTPSSLYPLTYDRAEAATSIYPVADE